MAKPAHGRHGRLYVGLASAAAAASPVAQLNQWNISFATDKVDVTSFGDGNKVKLSGLPDATGSFAGFYDTESNQMYTAASDGEPRKFYLYPMTQGSDVGTYWSGLAIFDFSVSASVNGAVEVSGSFEGAGPVVKTTA